MSLVASLPKSLSFKMALIELRVGRDCTGRELEWEGTAVTLLPPRSLFLGGSSCQDVTLGSCIFT